MRLKKSFPNKVAIVGAISPPQNVLVNDTGSELLACMVFGILGNGFG
jgi:hypothetical protein